VAARHGANAQIEAFPTARASEAIEKVKKNWMPCRAIKAAFSPAKSRLQRRHKKAREL
jgi:hypothetical protein